MLFPKLLTVLPIVIYLTSAVHGEFVKEKLTLEFEHEDLHSREPSYGRDLWGLSDTAGMEEGTIDYNGFESIQLPDDVLYSILKELPDELEFDLEFLDKGCSHGQCKFCSKDRFLHICIEASYLAHKIGFEIRVTIRGKTIFHKEISVANPPALCVNHIPFLSKIANLCIEFYDVSLPTKSACVRAVFVVKLGPFKKKINLKIACFHIPIPGDGDDMAKRY